MSKISDFTISTPRPLPVIILADISGSMTDDGKIDALNVAVREMIRSFASGVRDLVEIHVSVITFGKDGAQVHSELTPAAIATWTPMVADGTTPLGAAIDLATTMIEDKQKIPARAYRPVLVLVSDGEPNDEWRGPLKRLLDSDRGSKADRFALAVGAGAGMDPLKEFLANPAKQVLQASDASMIPKFFRWVTMSVTARSKSATPNISISIDLDLDNF
jgi:uncharacterized protein YegL